MATLIECLLDDTNDVGEVLPATKRIRRSKAIKNEAIDADGNTIPYVPTMSGWYASYVMNPNLEWEKFQRNFRLWFRLPYDSFLELLELVKANDLFQR